MTPTFFINGRRYEGPWDENLWPRRCWARSAIDFTLRRWISFAGRHRPDFPPADVGACRPVGEFLLRSRLPVLVGQVFGFQLGGSAFVLPLLNWMNDGLLAIFFLVVGLEIKREFTVGRLATLRPVRCRSSPHLAALPPDPDLSAHRAPGPGGGLGGADRYGYRVCGSDHCAARSPRPVELRVFLTAAVIIDDLVAIGIIAAFYTEQHRPSYLVASVAVTRLLVAMNQLGVYSRCPTRCLESFCGFVCMTRACMRHWRE